MIINSKSINNISKHFQPLSTSFNAWDYNVDIEARVFTYSQDHYLNIENLQQIFCEDNDKIRGIIKKVSPECALKIIKEEISDYPFYDYDDLTANKGFAQFREKALWIIINEYFNYKPDIAYLHDPDSGSYFDVGVMWQFCYIFLNKGRGIALSACAFD